VNAQNQLGEAIWIWLALCASLSLIACVAAIVSVWIRARPPEFSRLETAVSEVRTSLVDIQDKWEHWVKRHNARRINAAKEAAGADDINQDKAPLVGKDFLRQKLAERFNNRR